MKSFVISWIKTQFITSVNHIHTSYIYVDIYIFKGSLHIFLYLKMAYGVNRQTYFNSFHSFLIVHRNLELFPIINYIWSYYFRIRYSHCLFSLLFFDFHLGGLISYLSGLFGGRERRILILGLDGAGKTTILYRLQVGEVVTTIPSVFHIPYFSVDLFTIEIVYSKFKTLLNTSIAIGFNVETVQYKNLKLQVWDLGGQTSIRPYWRCAHLKASV